MTTTIEQAPAPSPRGLVPEELFDELAAYVAKAHHVTLSYAEGVIEQTLVWLRAVADNPGVRLAMSETVDLGWHAFILHSEEYLEFCRRLMGRYLHHVPPAPGTSMSEDAITRTIPALRATGYPVDLNHWSGPHYPCCPPNPCTKA
jgi:hypothetical protein